MDDAGLKHGQEQPSGRDKQPIGDGRGLPYDSVESKGKESFLLQEEIEMGVKKTQIALLLLTFCGLFIVAQGQGNRRQVVKSSKSPYGVKLSESKPSAYITFER